MNVILVNDFAHVNGGAGQVALKTAELLSSAGVKVILFSAVGPVSPALEEKKNLQVICLGQKDILHDPCRVRAICQGFWNWRAAAEFDLLLKKYSPRDTIIHIHTLSKAISTSILPVARKYRFKTVYHMHDYGIACPNMGFYNYRKNIICKKRAMNIQCILCNCDSRSYLHKGWRVIRQWIQQRIGKLPNSIDCMIYISRFSFNILRPYLRGGQSAEYLPNFVDVKRNERIEVENNHAFIFIGRMSPEKNPELLAEAAKTLGVPVIFIGSGVCADSVKKINSNAILTGWLSHEQMEFYLKQARALVFPSKWYEGQPLTVLEAKAYGIPAIVSDVCAARDEIEDDKTGLLFKSEDKSALINCMQKLEDDSTIRLMSKAAYSEYWDKGFDNHQYLKKLIMIYQKVLNKK